MTRARPAAQRVHSHHDAARRARPHRRTRHDALHQCHDPALDHLANPLEGHCRRHHLSPDR